MVCGNLPRKYCQDCNNTTSHHLAKEMGNKSSSSSSGKQSAAEVMPSPEDLAAMKPAGQKAWKFRVDASQKIHSRSPFGRESRLEDASELAEKAATQFKLAKMYDEAAECYQMQADCCMRSQEPMSAAGALIQAGEVYGKHGNTENAFEVYHSAIELYKDGGKFDRAGKHQQALADVSLFAGRFPLLFSSFFFSLSFFWWEGGAGGVTLIFVHFLTYTLLLLCCSSFKSFESLFSVLCCISC